MPTQRMSATELVSVEVPDIGDFADVPVIEILVAPGDSVAVDDPLLTLESDKATMDVPAPFAGTIRELHVDVGDRVSQGTPLLALEPSSDAGTRGPRSRARMRRRPPNPAPPRPPASRTRPARRGGRPRTPGAARQ